MKYSTACGGVNSRTVSERPWRHHPDAPYQVDRGRLACPRGRRPVSRPRRILAQALGVTKGGFYGYFAGRGALRSSGLAAGHGCRALPSRGTGELGLAGGLSSEPFRQYRLDQVRAGFPECALEAVGQLAATTTMAAATAPRYAHHDRPGVSTDPAPCWETTGTNREQRAKRRAVRPADPPAWARRHPRPRPLTSGNADRRATSAAAGP